MVAHHAETCTKDGCHIDAKQVIKYTSLGPFLNLHAQAKHC